MSIQDRLPATLDFGPRPSSFGFNFLNPQPHSIVKDQTRSRPRRRPPLRLDRATNHDAGVRCGASNLVAGLGGHWVGRGRFASLQPQVPITRYRRADRTTAAVSVQVQKFGNPVPNSGYKPPDGRRATGGERRGEDATFSG